MRRILIAGLIIALVSALAVLAIPAFAHGLTERDSGTSDQETWQAMHEACEEGDWDTMVEAAEEVHEGLDSAPCHGDDYPASEEGSPGGWLGWHDGMVK